ncbi:hypothetical protein B0H11DRAFT_2325065 [Mycena galericulata]|nr:hypothetical protein B0H11DRAFT_2325065 [Mycena galericulata]
MRAGARRNADPMRTVRVPSRSIDNPGFISRTACRPRPPRLYPVRCPPHTLPAAIALVACLPSLFATAVATLLTTTQSGPPCSLLAHHTPEIAYNHLAAVHAPPKPWPLATAVPNAHHGICFKALPLGFLSLSLANLETFPDFGTMPVVLFIAVGIFRNELTPSLLDFEMPTGGLHYSYQ